MKLENVQEVDFEFVRESYLKDHGIKDGWELNQLKKANEKFGRWIYAEIPPSEVGKIVVPHYRHLGIIVVPTEGSFLEISYQNFKGNREHFERGNRQFCRRIDLQKKRILEGDIKTIFLSQEPLFNGASYEGLTRFKRHITHLDGHHRLMALMALFDEKKYNHKPIKSCIASYPNILRRNKIHS